MEEATQAIEVELDRAASMLARSFGAGGELGFEFWREQLSRMSPTDRETILRELRSR